MAHHAGDPFRIGGAGAHDPADFLFERTDLRAFGARMVIVIDFDAFALQRLDRGGKPTLELVIIIAIEKVMLAIILIVNDRFDGAQTPFQGLAFGAAFQTGAIGIVSPLQIGFGKICIVLP